MANGINRQPNRGISPYYMLKFYNNFAYHRWTNRGLEFTVLHHRLSLLTWNSPSPLLFKFQNDLVTTCASWRSHHQISLSAPCAIWRSLSIFYSTYYFLLLPLQRSSSSQPPRKIFLHPIESG